MAGRELIRSIVLLRILGATHTEEAEVKCPFSIDIDGTVFRMDMYALSSSSDIAVLGEAYVRPLPLHKLRGAE